MFMLLVTLNTHTFNTFDTPAAQWDAFKGTFQRSYDSAAEEASRFEFFKLSLEEIAQFNADREDPAEYGVTRWADRSPVERANKCGNSTTARVRPWTMSFPKRDLHVWNGTCYAGRRPEFAHLCNEAEPIAFDWTEHGAVTHVKDQGDCGNCFTFGATADFEASWFLAGHELVSLSEQQLTSCDRNGGDSGCGGGSTNLDTDQYATENGGIASESTYPLCSGTRDRCPGQTIRERRNGVCNQTAEKQVSAVIIGGYQVSGGLAARECDWCPGKQPIDEEVMKRHLVRAGPMTIAINSKFFDHYRKGVMKPAAHKCPGKDPLGDLDHQVFIVGYGHDEQSGLDYWRIK